MMPFHFVDGDIFVFVDILFVGAVSGLSLCGQTAPQGEQDRQNGGTVDISISQLRAGESAKWGQQIRNYVLQPYKLIKDTRTKYEETDADAVLNGKLEGFIDAYLELQLGS